MKIENPNLESFYKNCPIRSVLDSLGDRWTVLVLIELNKEPKRFSALRREIQDISPRMLSQTVRRLEQSGLVRREVFPTIPPRVEYSMTELGLSFVASFQGVVEWAAENFDAVMTARANYVPPTGESLSA